MRYTNFFVIQNNFLILLKIWRDYTWYIHFRFWFLLDFDIVTYDYVNPDIFQFILWLIPRNIIQTNNHIYSLRKRCQKQNIVFGTKRDFPKFSLHISKERMQNSLRICTKIYLHINLVFYRCIATSWLHYTKRTKQMLPKRFLLFAKRQDNDTFYLFLLKWNKSKMEIIFYNIFL